MKWKTEIVVSSISGRLLCEIGEVYAFLDWFLHAKLFTHQLPGAGLFARPYVLKQLPKLKIWVEEAEREDFNSENWQKFRNAMLVDIGEEIEVCRLPPRTYRQCDPLKELQEMAPHSQIIVVKP